LQGFTKVLQPAVSLLFDEADERDETLYQDDESVAKPMSEKRRADTDEMEDDSDESILVDLYEDEDDDASIHHGSEDESDDVSIDTRTIGLGAAGPSVPPPISNQLSASANPPNIQKQLRD
jgi:hypothetical protein